ncbi:type II secretion system protein GspL [Psychrobacter sp. I-STPA6b]|uniref:type II secretion system protein GspL n=1 Tax=Psychrobacter sp. I-STPA6b TaxID=2585718 RepID=UPI001D0C5700|nr:type II secretion system protein GspL [Psychrobacter sp. I-STPA6b]
MQHIWLATQPNKNGSLRVWVAAQKTWQWLSDWQALRSFYNDNNISDKVVCLYIPTQSVLSVESELSVAQLKQLGTSGQQYLFEDISLSAVEQLHVKILSTPSQHYLYALASSQIEQWQQSATLADVTVQAILPDFILLPIPEVREGSQVVIYHDDDTTLLRTSVACGMAVSYLPLLSSQLNELPALDELTLITPADNQQLISSVQQLQMVSTTMVTTEEQSAPENQPVVQSSVELATILNQSNALIHISTESPVPLEYPERHALNMVEKQRQQILSPYLKATVFVALFAGVLQMSADAFQWYQYQQATVSTQEKTAEQYAYWFNNEPLNSRTTLIAQVEPRLLPAQTTDTSQLGVLSRIAPLIKQSGMSAQNLSWDDGAIRLTLLSQRREALDALVTTLAEQGINANLGSVTPQAQGEDGVIGELMLPLGVVDTTKNSGIS